MIDQIRLMNIINQIYGPQAQGMPSQEQPIGQNMPSPTFPNQGVMIPQQQQMGQEDNNNELLQQIASIFKPNEDQFNKLSQSQDQMPQRSNFKPTLMQKIAAMGANLGTAGAAGISSGSSIGFNGNIKEGLNAQNEVLNGPYNRALASWKEKQDSLGKLATLEGSRNTNDRLIGSTVLTNDRAAKKADATSKQNDIKNAQNQEKIDIQRDVAAVAKYRAEHPNLKSVIDDNGMLVLYDPGSGEIKQTGVDTGKMNDADKLSVQLENRLSAIKAQGNESRNTEGFRQANRMETEATRQANRIDLKQTPAPSSTTTTAADQKTRQFMRAQEAINTHPEWAPYISLMQGNTFQVKAPEEVKAGPFGGGAKAGGDPKVVEQINKFIYDKESNVSPQSTGAKSSTGKVMMLAPDGKTVGYVPAEREADYINNGYSRVKSK